MHNTSLIVFFLLLLTFGGCGTPANKGTYVNAEMDFGMLQTVAVLPFQNLTSDQEAGERVRDAFMGMLLATEAVYVLPPGEIARGIARVAIDPPSTPTIEQIKTLSGILQVDAVVTGVLREYETVRSGSSEANVISLSLRMIETETGTVIWSASSTKGGISIADRLFGGGGQSKNIVTTEACNELLDKLFR